MGECGRDFLRGGLVCVGEGSAWVQETRWAVVGVDRLDLAWLGGLWIGVDARVWVNGLGLDRLKVGVNGWVAEDGRGSECMGW